MSYEDFPLWLVALWTILGLVSSEDCSSCYFWGVLLLLQEHLHTHADQVLHWWLWRSLLQISGAFSWCRSLISVSLSWEFRGPWLPGLLGSEWPLGPIWVSPFCAAIWKLSPGCQLEQSQGPYHYASPSLRHHCLHCLVFHVWKTTTSYILSDFLHRLRWSINLLPITPS